MAQGHGLLGFEVYARAMRHALLLRDVDPRTIVGSRRKRKQPK